MRRPRFSRRSTLVVLGAIAAAALAGCLADEAAPPVAGLLVGVTGSDAVRGRAPIRSNDGYELQLQRAMLGLGAPLPQADQASPRAPGMTTSYEYPLETTQGCIVESQTSVLFGADARHYVWAVYDFRKDEPLKPLPRWNVRLPACPRYALGIGSLAPDLSYVWGGDTVDVQRNPTYSALDDRDLVDTTGVVAMRALVTGKAKRVLLDLVVDMAVEIRECGRLEGTEGVAYSAGNYVQTDLVFEGERLFSDDPKAADDVRLEEIVAADADGDGVVTAAELMARPTSHPLDFEWSYDGSGQVNTSVVADLLDVFAYRMTYAFRDTRLGRCSAGFMPAFDRFNPPESEYLPDGGYIPPKQRLAIPAVRRPPRY